MTTDPQLSLLQAIHLTADIMTIFGLSGFFTWSFVKKSVESTSPADVGVTAFALAVKTLLCLIVAGMLLLPAGFAHIFLVLIFSGSYSATDSFWSDQKSTAHVLAYVVNALWYIPTVVLFAACIFTWSLEPIDRFGRAFTRSARDGG
jgi:hypothetical protein